MVLAVAHAASTFSRRHFVQFLFIVFSLPIIIYTGLKQVVLKLHHGSNCWPVLTLSEEAAAEAPDEFCEFVKEPCLEVLLVGKTILEVTQMVERHAQKKRPPEALLHMKHDEQDAGAHEKDYKINQPVVLLHLLQLHGNALDDENPAMSPQAYPTIRSKIPPSANTMTIA